MDHRIDSPPPSQFKKIHVVLVVIQLDVYISSCVDLVFDLILREVYKSSAKRKMFRLCMRRIAVREMLS